MAANITKEANISLENVCLLLANDLILRFDLPLIRIIHVKQIRSPFLLCLYDAIFGSVPPGVFLHPKSDEEEIINIETITERLKSDLKRSLDPLKVLNGDPDTIYELFCVFLNKAKKCFHNQIPMQENDGPRLDRTLEEGTNEKHLGKRNDNVHRGFSELSSDDNDQRPISFIEFVSKELSDMDVSIATKRQLIRKYEQYILFEVKTVSNAEKGKSKSLILLEDARSRQATLTTLLLKELELGKRLEVIEARKKEQLAEKGRVRDDRIQAARLRRIRKDVEASRGKQKSQRKNRKEVILKEICDENLAMRKTRLLNRLKDEKEQKETESAKAELKCKAAAKFYEDQVLMMADKLKTEKASIFLQERSNSKLVDKLKREERKERMRKVKRLEDQAKQKREQKAQLEEEEAQRMKIDLWSNF